MKVVYEKLLIIVKFSEAVVLGKSTRAEVFAGLSRTVFLLSLQDVLMQDSRLYLIFEFLSMDLKKYLDSIPPGQFMDSSLVKVRLYMLL